MREIIVASWEDAKTFSRSNPYAIISFVDSDPPHRAAPRYTPRSRFLIRRIIVRADDSMPRSVNYVTGRPDGDGQVEMRPYVFSPADAQRIVRFVASVESKIDTLLIHCVQGLGRSTAAAISIAKAYGLPFDQWLHEPYAPNPWISNLLDDAFARERRRLRLRLLVPKGTI